MIKVDEYDLDQVWREHLADEIHESVRGRHVPALHLAAALGSKVCQL